MTAFLIAGAVAAVALPHVVRPAVERPAAGAALWTGVLVLRALCTLLLVGAGMLLAASSEYARDVAHVVWHTELTSAVAQAGADNHTAMDVLLLLPALGMAGAVGYGVWRSARAAGDLRRAVDRTQLGDGPAGSVLVAEPRPMVAAIGLLRARIVISAGALSALEADELDAAIAHERAHISRGHRFVLLLAGACVTFARWQPGTTAAWRELRHQLERDADRCAARDWGGRLALASAICKVALHGRAAPAAPAAGLSGTGARGGVVDRVRELTAPPAGGSDGSTLLLCALTALAGAGALVHGLHLGQELSAAAQLLAHHPVA